uniref:Solute carrier organic anion transporter family member n=1 Tax=Steinernema glaseri TaxID=37863 RepID=A0A1I7YHR0_9BILA
MIDRLYVFIFVFAVVYYLEAIGGTYMVSAIQSIERQFQIPSKLTGFMVSASDIGYIPTVIFISYFGSKGNRAKWIGAGTFLIACCHLLISTPNFIFPVAAPVLNLTKLQSSLMPSPALFQNNVTLNHFMSYPPIADRIPVLIRQKLLEKVAGLYSKDDKQRFARSIVGALGEDHKNRTVQPEFGLYVLDEPLIVQIMKHVDGILNGTEGQESLINLLTLYAHHRANNSESDVAITRRAAIAPFSFCGRLVNDLRSVVNDLKCRREGSNMGPFVIIFTALLFLGVGRSMPWCLGVPLIDDNVKRKSMPVYFAGISFIRILGPICGFLVGSFANKLYYAYPAAPPPGLTPKDPTWIGAWWSGYVIIGLLTIVPSLILFFFPATGTKIAPEQDDSSPKTMKKELSFFDKHKDTCEEEESGLTRIQKFRKSYYEVVRSKVYLGSVAGRVLDILAFKGYMVFLPKYLENHYGIPQYKVHLYMAAFGVFGFAMGTVAGGLLTRWTRMNGRKVAFFVFFVSTLNFVIFFTKTFLGCSSIVNSVGANGRAFNFNYTQTCNAECGCDNAQLYPVCDSRGYAYFSPCHAGCRDVIVKDINSYELEFANCQCVSDGSGIVNKNFCKDDCSMMIVLFFLSVICGAFVAGTGVVPGMMILIRSVPPATRSIALGLQGFLVSLFGTLPSPVIWGAIIDSACLVWDRSCSGRKGACSIYDPDILRVKMHVIYVAIRIVAMFTDLYVLYHAKGLNILDDDEDDVEKVEPTIPLQEKTKHS